MMRMILYEAAQTMLMCSAKWSWLKAWAMEVARHCGMKKAIVALARRLAVIMHRTWVDGTEFRWTREVTAVSISRELEAGVRWQAPGRRDGAVGAVPLDRACRRHNRVARCRSGGARPAQADIPILNLRRGGICLCILEDLRTRGHTNDA